MHTLDSLIDTLLDDDLDEISSTTSRHHLSHQRSSTSTIPPYHLVDDDTPLPPCCSIDHRSSATSLITPCSPLHSVAPPSNGCSPRGASRVASLGQVQLQIFNFALTPIVGISPQINHMIRAHMDTKFIIKGTCRTCYFSLFLLNISQYNL
jgi:hypothetical protein